MSASVLIVDDDESLADNVAEIVASLGVATAVARDRKAALALAAAGDFAVALIDVRLPDGDGISLLEPLRVRSRFMQLVLVTGNATLEGAIAAVRGDAFAYVLKPVSPADLLETVRRALDQAGLYRERERLRVELEGSERRYRERGRIDAGVRLALASTDGSPCGIAARVGDGLQHHRDAGHDGSGLVGAGESPAICRCGRVARARSVAPRRGVGARRRAAVYAVGIDVTDEQALLLRTLRSERLAAVGTLAAGLAHEVRNPLNRGALQLAVLERRCSGARWATGDPHVVIIKDEIARLDRLVRDFLAFPSRHRSRPGVDLTSCSAGSLS